MPVTHVTVKLLRDGDVGLLADVADDVFDSAVSPDLAAAYLRESSNIIAVALAGSTVVGMATAFAYLHPDKPLQLFINEVGVSVTYQCQSIAKRLVELLLERGRELGCTEAWVATEEPTPQRERSTLLSKAKKNPTERSSTHTRCPKQLSQARRTKMTPNTSVERTAASKPESAAQVKHWPGKWTYRREFRRKDVKRNRSCDWRKSWHWL